VTDDPSSTNLNFHLDDGRILRLADNAAFDGITVSASDVGRQLAQREASQDADVPKVDVGAQPVFLFKTREGGVGVLQILDLTDNPRGVKIRYRIVRVAGARTSNGRIEPRSELERTLVTFLPLSTTHTVL
jgi:hypothetical protein